MHVQLNFKDSGIESPENDTSELKLHMPGYLLVGKERDH